MMPKATVLASFLIALATPAFAGEQTVDLSVPGMFCASCPYVVEAAIGGVDGVRSVSADADARTAQVVYDDAVTAIDDILAATENAGYAASVIPKGS